ncbi:hypothetical protein QUA44_13685 [Microcoleus sp. N9_A2]
MTVTKSDFNIPSLVRVGGLCLTRSGFNRRVLSVLPIAFPTATAAGL